MISVRKRAVARLAATALATALFAGGALATAGTAAAEEYTVSNGGATATLKGLETYGQVKVNGKKINAGLFSMDVKGGGTVKTYCIDFRTGAKNGHKYRETGWESTSLVTNDNAGKIHWILQNSYPQVDDLAALAATVGADRLSAEEAAAGTQAAIWYFSDDVEAVPTAKGAKALTTWLKANAEDLAEPESPSLELEPNSVGGIAGERVGPVTVRTSAGSVVIVPGAQAVSQGVTVVDGAGNPIGESTPVADGTELF